MDTAIIIFYTLASVLILFYSISQLNLLYYYLRSKSKKEEPVVFNLSNPGETPYVTIQLPIYNEMYVVERLLRNIAGIDYPMDKLEVQVLDDSTDESIEKSRRLVKELQQEGLDIQHITRQQREGFKAGALKEGLKVAKGEFIAIFDSDFLPKKDWLQKTVPYFKDPEIGVVQTRWGHVNRDYSLLTKIQAFALDFHFIMEQTGRNFGKHFINFNGTAGIWRKACIEDAGNWSGDTLTEDLDLSYRAQMKKWKFKYLEDVETPAELPVVMSAARSQQFRWNKGAAENFQKNYKVLLRDRDQTTGTKIHGFFHLLNSSFFIVLLLLAVLSVPVLYIKNMNPQYSWFFNFIALFTVSALIFLICYWVTWSKLHGKSFRSYLNFTGMFFAFFSVAMGLSLHNSLAVLQGHFGKRSEFVRTPKFNIGKVKDSWKGNIYLNKSLSATIILEFLLWLYFGFAIYSAFKLEDYGLFVFHLMLFAGFGFVVLKSLTNKT
ncbi:glycosyltransferase [Antarcticibacterium flavum]|uniref:Glycosyltransferase n=1 Tax=Antarcticibacterium flavum TaxID=2058175 RepID=A0A5B7X2Z8_9FLAO|nr:MULTISPECIES: cellulose synthase family protein [Antarcticibacterium]MCM4159478.1 glycosyl transferase family 2 [Antarcticibacterium sp. W02-3]QCY69886.1 glycosyltransferase [Antarcticibacterium flavum]